MSTYKILDTTAGETGGAQSKGSGNERGLFDCELASGDVIEIESLADGGVTWKPLFTFNAVADPATLVDPLPHQYRARRSTDGGVGDTTITVKLYPER